MNQCSSRLLIKQLSAVSFCLVSFCFIGFCLISFCLISICFIRFCLISLCLISLCFIGILGLSDGLFLRAERVCRTGFFFGLFFFGAFVLFFYSLFWGLFGGFFQFFLGQLSDPPPSLIIIKIHSRLPREGGGTGEKGKREKKALSRGSVEGVCRGGLSEGVCRRGSVGGGLSEAQRKNKTNNPVKVRCM